MEKCMVDVGWLVKEQPPKPVQELKQQLQFNMSTTNTAPKMDVAVESAAVSGTLLSVSRGGD